MSTHYATPPTPKRGFIRRLFSAIGTSITWLRNTMLNLVFLLIVIFIIAAISSNSPKPLPKNFALRLAPSGMLVDQLSYTDPASLLLADENQQEQETLVSDVIEAINAARNDPRVNTLVIEPGKLAGGGISKLSEIGQAIEQFKRSGKKVVAAAYSYSQDQYFLASFADEIYLHEMGSIEITGYSRYSPYFKTALDKLGIRIHAFRAGKYKDALEPLLRDDMSQESREHNQAWVNELWQHYTTQVEQARQLGKGQLSDMINHYDELLLTTAGNSAQLALENSLVDKLFSRSQLIQQLNEIVGHSNKDGHYKHVELQRYLAEQRSLLPIPSDTIGVINAVGNISDGHARAGSIGSDSFLKLLQQAQNANLKALVIRIDSGGGSAFASEIIRSEIARVRENGLPVFISMGSVAASGGYWIATAADEIWAQPTTITGSIGVFGALPTAEQALNNMGIYSDGVGSTELAGSMSLSRPLSPKVERIVQQNVEYIYQRFLALVADARQQTPEQIDERGQGHVWSGEKAKALGLVDELGTLQDVIAAAATHAQVENYRVQAIELPVSPREELLRSLANSSQGLVSYSLLNTFSSLQLLNQLSAQVKPLQELQQLNDPQGIYVKCLVCTAL